MNKEEILIYLRRIGKGLSITIPFMVIVFLIGAVMWLMPFLWVLVPCIVLCYMVGHAAEELGMDDSIIKFVSRQVERFKAHFK